MLKVLTLYNLITLCAGSVLTPSMLKVILVPGNGGAGQDTLSSNWYGWLAESMKDSSRKAKADCLVENYPDPFVARSDTWLPHINKMIDGDNENTILIGHSSGALAAMRMAEMTKLKGIILVSPAHTDLGDENERASGYFDTPWDYGAQVSNCDLIHIFHSDDDHLIPVAEARHVALQMTAEAEARGVDEKVVYQEMKGHSHFFEPFDEILQVLDHRFLGVGKNGGEL